MVRDIQKRGEWKRADMFNCTCQAEEPSDIYGIFHIMVNKCMNKYSHLKDLFDIFLGNICFD